MRRRRRVTVGLAVVSIGVAWLLASPSKRVLDVSWTGCAEIRAGPICGVAETSTMTLWISEAETRGCEAPVIRRAGSVVAATNVVVDGGRQYRVLVGPERSQLVVSACADSARWSLDIQPHNKSPVLRQLEELRRNEPRRALAALEKISATTEGRADALRARIIAKLDGFRAAKPVFDRAIATLEANGVISEACYARVASAFFATEALRLEDARSTLRSGEVCLASSPTHRAIWPYYEAMTAVEAFDLRAALRLVNQAVVEQRRLALHDRHLRSVELEARILRNIGRFEEADTRLSQPLPPHASCQRAFFSNQRGWTAMMAAEAKRPTLRPAEVERLFLAAIEAAPTCTAQVSPFIRLNLAFLHVELLRADEAEAELLRAEAELTGDDARTRAWRMELRGHIARLRGRHDEALSAFARLDAFGVARADEQARWRAALGRGRTLEMMERWEEAVEAYRAAERSVDRQLALVPFGEGRASFADARSPGTLRLLNVLLRLKRTEEAALVARRSLRRNVDNLVRASRLAALDAESRSRWESLLADYQRRQRSLQGDATATWQLSEEESSSLHEQRASIRASLRDTLDAKLISATNTEPRRPGPDEAMLVLHPLDGETWAAFALTAEQTRVERTQTPADVVKRFASVLRAKSQVVIVAPGALEDVDFHALDLDGRPLGEAKSVRYALDLAVAGNVPTPRRALIARDRTGTLRNADAEEAAVRAALDTSAAGSTPSALYDALATAEHFHFAGHGKSAGPDGIESALRISEHLQLTTSDILHLPRVPDTVVLAGCDLARTEPLATTLTLGAAQAFVVRGAQRVVAAVRPVADEDAVRFARLFYGALKEAETFDAAFRAAQHQTREAAPDSDWAAFRMFGP